MKFLCFWHSLVFKWLNFSSICESYWNGEMDSLDVMDWQKWCNRVSQCDYAEVILTLPRCRRLVGHIWRRVNFYTANELGRCISPVEFAQFSKGATTGISQCHGTNLNIWRVGLSSPSGGCWLLNAFFHMNWQNHMVLSSIRPSISSPQRVEAATFAFCQKP